MPDSKYTISNVTHLPPAKPTGFTATNAGTANYSLYDTSLGVAVTRTGTNISFSWNANPESNISLYEVINAATGQLVYKGTGTSGSYFSTALSGTVLTFYVITIDQWNNSSLASTSQSVTI